VNLRKIDSAGFLKTVSATSFCHAAGIRGMSAFTHASIARIEILLVSCRLEAGVSGC
jgi:hypothetical protein